MKLWPTEKRLLFVGIQILLLVVLGVSAGHYCTSMPGSSYAGWSGLSIAEYGTRDALRKHVEVLAGKIGRRDLTHYEGLSAAAEYIRTSFRESRYEPIDQAYVVDNKTVYNIEVRIRGQSLPDEIVVVGAHYDSISSGPGANDNASGVAALLRLAWMFQEEVFERSVYLVAFVNGEPPYFQTKNMGSRVYAARLREQGANVVAMYSLETIGCYSESPESQKYPFPFNL